MNWKKTEYDVDVNLIATPKGFKFTFPGLSGHVNSIWTSRKGTPVKPIQTLTLHYNIRVLSGNPKFAYCDHSSTSTTAPNFRPRIATEFLANRYWPAGTNCAILKFGDDQIYTVRLAPKLFQDVNGHADPKGFKATLKQDGIWVLSFGGGGNFEHGVYVTGGIVTFELLKFTVS